MISRRTCAATLATWALLAIAQPNFAQEISIMGVFRMVNLNYPTSTTIYFDFKQDATFIYKEVTRSRLTEQKMLTSKSGRWELAGDTMVIRFIDTAQVVTTTQNQLMFLIKNSELIYTYRSVSGKFLKYNVGQLRRLPEKFMDEYISLLSR